MCFLWRNDANLQIAVFIILVISPSMYLVEGEIYRVDYHFESQPFSQTVFSNFRQKEGFAPGSKEAESGEYLLSAALYGFHCPIDNNDPAPHIDVTGGDGNLIKRWRCDDLTSRQKWLTLDAIAGDSFYNITISNGTAWKSNWNATVLTTLYKTNYTTSGACPTGYFDCKSPSKRCLEPNRQHDSQRCILDSGVCNGTPNCGMICNVDETEVCDSLATTKKPEKDKTTIPVWVYYAIGGVIGVIVIGIVCLAIFRRVYAGRNRNVVNRDVELNLQSRRSNSLALKDKNKWSNEPVPGQNGYAKDDIMPTAIPMFKPVKGAENDDDNSEIYAIGGR